jgi:hypothetical protein
MALAAVSSIVLAVGCGSSSSGPAPNPEGFGLTSLNGTYVFSSQGVDANGAPLAIAGALVSVGTGTITGTIDVIDPEFDISPNTPPSPAAQPITSGSYNVGTDGRGRVSLTSVYGTYILDFVLTSTSHGLVSEFDTLGTGSGTIDLQTALTGVSQLAGPYALSLAGTDSSGDPFATAGAFTLNSGGVIAAGAGVEDFNDEGATFPAESLTGAATLGSGTGPGSITLTTSSFPLTYDFYAIDATHLKLIETDYAQFLAGDVFTQTGASIPTGVTVFTMAGGSSSSAFANGGLMTSDGSGNFTGGLEDVNDDGVVPAAQVPFSGALDAGASGPVGGRVFVNLTNFIPATNWVIYPSSGGLLMLEMDSTAVITGAAFARGATSFTASGGYGLNFTGVNSNGDVNYIAQFNASSPTSSPNITGTLDDNEFAAPLNPISLLGTYAPDSPADGRGSITAPTTGTLGTFVGALNLEYYVVDPSTVLFVDLDSIALDGGQLGIGTFEAQSSPSSAARAQSRISLAHPVARAHGAFRRK